MKNLENLKLSVFSFLLLFGLFLSSAAVAADDNKESKAVIKARAAVKQAAPDDWYTLANSAQVLIQKNESLKEAAEWIDKSLEITETPYNLEVKGDYYVANKLPGKAIEYYVKSILSAQDDPDFEVGRVQTKIMKLKNN